MMVGFIIPLIPMKILMIWLGRSGMNGTSVLGSDWLILNGTILKWKKKKSWQLENKAISPRERIVFQLAFLRGYVSFGEGVCRLLYFFFRNCNVMLSILLYVYECVWCIKREKNIRCCFCHHGALLNLFVVDVFDDHSQSFVLQPATEKTCSMILPKTNI